MTREEAIKMARAELKCMERDVSGQDEMCNNHKCDECSLNYERGNMGERKEWLRMAIKALKQEPVLDKIRAEIETARFVDKDTKLCKNANASGLEVAMQIIDKIKAEVMSLTDGCTPELIRNVDVLEIIDRYKAESEVDNV